ncbi:MAG: hypothetical protein HEQ23_04330 [Tepidisphaera sp.]
MKKLVTIVLPVAILAAAGVGLVGCEEKKAAPKPADVKPADVKPADAAPAPAEKK